RRDPSRTPLFQVLCVMQNAPEADLSLPAVEARPWHVPQSVALFDLTVQFEPVQEGLDVRLMHSVELFEPATIERMAGRLRGLLEATAAGPDRAVRDLPLLTGEERSRLRAWSLTDLEHDRRPVHARFEEQARWTPDAVAVECGQERVAYGELN